MLDGGGVGKLGWDEVGEVSRGKGKGRERQREVNEGEMGKLMGRVRGIGRDRMGGSVGEGGS